ncbi:MAG: cache domain-containing protein [Dehalococcoidia bacterium]|nr:cache domain-containing protein [Dehalococcoidia bacterium]
MERIVRDSIADIPQPSPGLGSQDVERIVQAAIADIPAPAAMMKSEGMVETKLAVAPPKSTPDAYTQYLVKEAISRYKSDGLDATVTYYNTPESIDGQWYVFIGDENDMMLAHAGNPDLVGQPFSYATGPNAYPAGSAVAASADEDGEWFSYTFRNPATGGVETKHSWMVRYDGLVFGTGWYEDGPTKSDAPAYTQSFVRRAIALYDAVGLDDTVAFYNMPESIDGQWYIFIGDEEDTLIAHPANPSLVGVPAVEVKGSNAYPSGAAVAAVADQDGEWFSYIFPNPATGGVETKHSWMVRYDGLVFGSGWYEDGPAKSDAPAYTKAFVHQAINLYNAVGLDRTIDYNNNPESVDGQWYVFVIDGDGYTISHHNPMFIGRDPALRVDSTGHFYGDELTGATEAGRWVDYVLINPETGAEQQKHTWAVRHDGLIFGSGWYEG